MACGAGSGARAYLICIKDGNRQVFQSGVAAICRDDDFLRETAMYQRILVPTDGSGQADVAARAAVSFAQACDVKIRVAATRRHCNLIFGAFRGRRGLGQPVAGSVTRRVLACPPLPVMADRLHLAHARGRPVQDSPDAARAPG